MALLDNLVSYWKLDEASGTRVDIASTNNLTDNNTVGSAAGKIGSAGDFEATNLEYLNSSAAALRFGDEDFTLAAWINLESSVDGSVIARYDNSLDADRVFTINYVASTQEMQFLIRVGGASYLINASTFGALSLATWYHVVAWHSATSEQMGISVNNTANTQAHTAGLATSTVDFTVGARLAGATAFDGLIDEVGAWGTVLSSTDRTNLYNGGSGLSYPFYTQAPRIVRG
jgi:hypothetical protein